MTIQTMNKLLDLKLKEDNAFYEKSIKPILDRFGIREANRFRADDIKTIVDAIIGIDGAVNKLQSGESGGISDTQLEELKQDIEDALKAAGEAKSGSGAAMKTANDNSTKIKELADKHDSFEKSVGNPTNISVPGAESAVDAINKLYLNGSVGGVDTSGIDLSKYAQKTYVDDEDDKIIKAMASSFNGFGADVDRIDDEIGKINSNISGISDKVAALEKKPIGNMLKTYEEDEYGTGAFITTDNKDYGKTYSSFYRNTISFEIVPKGDTSKKNTRLDIVDGSVDVWATTFMWNGVFVATCEDVEEVRNLVFSYSNDIDSLKSLTDNIVGSNISVDNNIQRLLHDVEILRSTRGFTAIKTDNFTITPGDNGAIDVHGLANYGINIVASNGVNDQLIVKGEAIDGSDDSKMQMGMMTIADKRKLDGIQVNSLYIKNDTLYINGKGYKITAAEEGGEIDDTPREYYTDPVVSLSYGTAPASGQIAPASLTYSQYYVEEYPSGNVIKTPVETEGADIKWLYQASVEGSYHNDDNGSIFVPENKTTRERAVGIMQVIVTMNGLTTAKSVTVRQAAAQPDASVYYGAYDGITGLTKPSAYKAAANEITSSQLIGKLKQTSANTFSDNWKYPVYFIMVRKGKANEIKLNQISAAGTTPITLSGGGIIKSPTSDESYDIYYALFTGATELETTVNVTIS